MVECNDLCTIFAFSFEYGDLYSALEVLYEAMLEADPDLKEFWITNGPYLNYSNFTGPNCLALAKKSREALSKLRPEAEVGCSPLPALNENFAEMEKILKGIPVVVDPIKVIENKCYHCHKPEGRVPIDFGNPVELKKSMLANPDLHYQINERISSGLDDRRMPRDDVLTDREKEALLKYFKEVHDKPLPKSP